MSSRRAPRWLPFLIMFAATSPRADDTVTVCYNYSCVGQAPATFAAARLDRVRDMLAAANSSAREREVLAAVVGQLYGWAAEQTPIGNDKAGNLADGGAPGQMDCIDHSTTTTRLLRMLEKRGWLRFHRVVEPVRRGLIFEHYSAAVEDLGDGIVRPESELRIWVVDSWYADNGKPAWVAPLNEWKRRYETSL